MKVQFLSFEGCPNAKPTLELLERALAAHDLTMPLEMIDVLAESTPEDLRAWGSPTILIDGEDIAGDRPSAAPCCRTYSGSRGVPSERLIRQAIERARLRR